MKILKNKNMNILLAATAASTCLVAASSGIMMLHAPRLYINNRYLLNINTKYHGEDSYQKNRNELEGRIFAWTEFECSESEWKEYLVTINKYLLNLYRNEFYDLLKNVKDEELVSIQTTDKVMSYTPFGDVVSTWIDYEKKILRTCFNHEWCSGQFFLDYGFVIFQGDKPKLPNFPKLPFIPEYHFVKMALTRPDKPISNCFKTDIQTEDIKRINYNMDISQKPSGISSRTFILWNCMTIINNVCPKDYNILIPVPFSKVKNVRNNIGVIFIKWPKSGLSMINLEKTIKKNLYHTTATNLFLRGNTFSSNGTKGRNNIDLVFTSAYIKNPKIIAKSHCATFNRVADYGIYLNTNTLEKKTYITLTISTNEINFEKLVKLIENDYEIPSMLKECI